MSKRIDKLISELFADSVYIEILCSIYENEITSASIAKMLNLNKDEVTKKIDFLVKHNLVVRTLKNRSYTFTLKNPKVCDSILMLKDAIYSIQ